MKNLKLILITLFIFVSGLQAQNRKAMFFTQQGAATETELVYSLRKFYGWENAVLKIRRSSDNATAFLFFDGSSSSDLITTSSYISTTSNTTPDTSPNVTLATWIGSNDGFVEEWIAQETDGVINDNHTPAQPATSAQPKVVSAGAIVTENSLPALDFDGGDNLELKKTSDPDNYIAVLDNGNDWTIYTVSNIDSANAIGAVFCNNDNSSRRIAIFCDTRTQKRLGVIVTTVTTYWINLLSRETSTTQRLFTLNRDSSSKVTSYFNGTEQSNITYTGTWDNVAIRIGSQNGNQTKLNGRIQEIWIVPVEETAKHSNINTYYSIY